MVCDAMLNSITDGGPAVDPHSVPQLITYAVLLSVPLKNALTGRAKPGTATAVGVFAVRLMIHIVSALLANTNSVLPSGLTATNPIMPLCPLSVAFA